MGLPSETSRHKMGEAASGGWVVAVQVAVFGPPSRSRPAHIVLFGAVGADGIAGHFAPEGGEGVAENGERAGQQSRRGTRNGQYGPTHDLNPHHRAGAFRPLFPWSSPRAARFMRGDHGAAGVKTGCVKGLVGAISCNQPFQSFTTVRGPAPDGPKLALWGLRRYISVEFPDITSGCVGCSRGFRPGNPRVSEGQ
jgi:hypothetical protein